MSKTDAVVLQRPQNPGSHAKVIRRQQRLYPPGTCVDIRIELQHGSDDRLYDERIEDQKDDDEPRSPHDDGHEQSKSAVLEDVHEVEEQELHIGEDIRQSIGVRVDQSYQQAGAKQEEGADASHEGNQDDF